MLTLIQKIAHLCLKPLIALFDFPIVPVELTTLVNKLFGYMQVGTGILDFFLPFDVIRPAIDVFLAVWAIEHAYMLVLWSSARCRCWVLVILALAGRPVGPPQGCFVLS